MADRNTPVENDRADPSGADEPLYSGAGNHLRILRKQRGLTLDEIATELKIGRHFVDALERGEFNKIPGTAYVLGFAKTYANFIDADTDAIIDALKLETTNRGRRAELNFPEPVSEASMARGPVLLAALLLVAIVYGIWYFVISAPPEGRGIDFLPDRLSEYLSPTPDDEDDGAESAGTAEAIEVSEPVSVPEEPAAQPNGGAESAGTAEAIEVSEPVSVPEEPAEQPNGGETDSDQPTSDDEVDAG